MKIFCYKNSIENERSEIVDFVHKVKTETDNLIKDCEHVAWDDKSYSAFVTATNKILSGIEAGISRLLQSRSSVYVIDELLSDLSEYGQMKSEFSAV